MNTKRASSSGHVGPSATRQRGALGARMLRVAVVGLLLAGSVVAALSDPVPVQLPGVALGSGPLLILERVGVIYGCGLVMLLCLVRAWHGQMLIGRSLVGTDGRRR